MLPSGAIFLLALGVCPSTAFWPLQCLMIRWPLIIMLVSRMWKVVFLLLFLRIFFPLGFRTTLRHISYYSWCVLVKFRVIPTESLFRLLFTCGLIFFIKCGKFSAISSLNIFLLLSLSLLLLGLITCMFVCVTVVTDVWGAAYFSSILFFLCIFQKCTFYWSIFTFTDSFFCHLSSVAESI